MQTTTRGQFWPLDPKADEIRIEDIAHALSNICRYGRQFYSVAEHSCHVSDHLPPDLALAGLLDDAAEAYIGDMIRPIKYSMPEYQEIDDRISAIIRKKFGIQGERNAEVIRVDNAILADESEQAMGGQIYSWGLTEKPLNVRLKFWSPTIAGHEFMMRFETLYR